MKSSPSLNAEKPYAPEKLLFSKSVALQMAWTFLRRLRSKYSGLIRIEIFEGLIPSLFSLVVHLFSVRPQLINLQTLRLNELNYSYTCTYIVSRTFIVKA